MAAEALGSITAAHNGDGNFAASAAAAPSVVVSQQGEGGAVAVAVRSSRNPDRVGQTVTFTATVSPLSPGAPAPTGTVTFYDGVGALGTVDLNGNQAAFATAALGVGRHPISVRYNGDAHYGATPSGQLVQLVSALEIYAIGGAPGRVQVRRVTDNTVLADFAPYGAGYSGEVSVAVGDGYGDVITGAVAGNPHVKVYSGQAIAGGTFNGDSADGSLLDQFFAYDLQFNVGAVVGAADFSGDGRDEVITGPTRGNPHYRVVPISEGGILPPSYNGLEGILAGFVGGIYVGG